MLTVSVAGVPGAMELGLMEHVGASTGDGCTEQVRATVPLNPFVGARLTVEVDDPPGLTIPGASVEAESEKSAGGKLNAANTTSAELVVVRLQTPVPEQGPFQPAKVEPAAAVAVSVTAVPGVKNAMHELGQSMPGGFAVTVPLPLPPGAMVRGKFGGPVGSSLNTVPAPKKPPNSVVP